MTSRSVIAKCGHIKRKINLGEALRGEQLEFALEILSRNNPDSKEQLLNDIARKLDKGQPLSDYELRIMGIMLLSARLDKLYRNLLVILSRYGLKEIMFKGRVFDIYVFQKESQ